MHKGHLKKKHPFIVKQKRVNKLGIEKNFLKLMKLVSKIPTDHIIPMKRHERHKAFP